MSTSDQYGISPKTVGKWAAAVAAALLVLIVLIFAIVVIAGSVSRYQSRENAKNNVKVSKTEIQNQAQRVQIAQQKAEIRKQDAIGVREAQDQIAKTLTPLYVQYEMTQVLMEVAKSGKNNSVIYLPAGAAGIPFVDDVSVNKVGGNR